jgi:hypothetical protein
VPIIDDETTDRPDVRAARRGADAGIGMQGEVAFAAATPEIAAEWARVYREAFEMEEKVLLHMRNLRDQLGTRARQEVDTTNIPIIQAHVASFKARLDLWEARAQALAGNGKAH